MKIGDRMPIPLASMKVVADPCMPKTRKTGRLLWQKDPFVTYEDSDKQWGLALGFCTEEEEPVVWRLNTEAYMPTFDLEMTTTGALGDLMERILSDICKPSKLFRFGGLCQ